MRARGTVSDTWSEQCNKTVYTRAIDNMGNISEVSSTTLKIDKTAPTATNVSASKTNTNESTVTIYANVEDTGGAGIEEVHFNGWFGGNWKTTNSKVSGTYDSTNKRYYATFTFSDIKHTSTGETGNGEGTYTFKAVAIDKAGNSIDSSNINVVYDTTKPICTITADKASTTNARTITYTFTFSEEVTGFTKEDVMVTNGIKGTFSGSKNIYTLVVTNTGNCTQTVSIASGICTDTAGNGNTSASKEITIDIANPTAGTMTMKLENGEDYTPDTWTNENVYISVNNGSDAESGHKSTTYKINSGEETAEPQTLTKSGRYEIVVTTTDNAGNIARNMYIAKIRRVKSIEITTNPIRLTYLAGDKFDSTGMEISVIYDNRDKEKTTEYTVANWPYLLKCGNNKIEIQYNNNPEIKTELEVEAQHIEEILEEKEPTCTEDGYREGKHCLVCNAILTKLEVIPALGHKDLEEITRPTCLEKGYTTHTCTRCRDTYTDSETEALGHSFTNYKSNNDATCTKDGTKTAKCDRCGKIDTQTDKGSMIPHTEVIDEGKPATCTEKGLTEGKHCSECKTIIVKQEVIPALGHSFTKYKSNNDATCTKDGTKTAKCDRCDETDTQTEVESKLSHNYENGICTECGVEEPKITITSRTYKIEEKYISKIQTKMTVKTFKENLQTNATEIKIYNKNGEEQEENSIVATGMTITFKLSNETKTLKLIVAGDVNGDGKADFKDMVSMNKHRLKKIALDGEYLMAGDITEDNKVDFKDIVKINKFRLNKIVQLFASL